MRVGEAVVGEGAGGCGGALGFLRRAGEERVQLEEAAREWEVFRRSKTVHEYGEA